MFTKISKEEDLRILKSLGYNIYDDIGEAKSNIYNSMSPGWKNGCENFMISTILTYIQHHNDIKRIIGQYDYMDRCTNTNAKSAIVMTFLCGEYLTIYEKRNCRTQIKEVLECYTERKISPLYNSIITLTDMINFIHDVSDHYFGDDFCGAVLDYIASIIHKYSFNKILCYKKSGKISKEEDLKILQSLGYNLYADLEYAKKRFIKSISTFKTKKYLYEQIMYSAINSHITGFMDLKKIIGKCDYMKRSTTTDDKCIIVIAYVYAEYVTYFGDSKGYKNKITEMLYHYTENKIYPPYDRGITSKDINNLMNKIAKDCFENKYYKELQNYIASMIYYYNL